VVVVVVVVVGGGLQPSPAKKANDAKNSVEGKKGTGTPTYAMKANGVEV
jgi:hypothetical protein